jgi:CheY-like chemotaxis protein/anti-sigma regulatory factor (Ser/Thr protein kinase)
MNQSLTKFCVMENGTLKLNTFETFNLFEFIQSIESICRYNPKTKKIVFLYDKFHECVYGDKHNLKHVVLNLITNAINYSTDDTPIVIHIRATEESFTHQNVHISVIDKNMKMEEHIKESLFEPYNSSSKSGLGLYICKHIIDLHNGTLVHTYNHNDKENIFDINIMFEKCIEEKKAALALIPLSVQPEQNSNSNSNSKHKYNIIIIDDSVVNLKLMTSLFKVCPDINTILTATTGLDGLMKIYNAKDTIDLVFIDNQLPDLNGLEVVKLLRGVHFNKLIFCVTGGTLGDTSGIDYVITKPLDKNLTSTLFRFLHKRDLSRYPGKTLQLIGTELTWV